MSGPNARNGQEDEQEPDFLEKRGFTWVALVVLLVVTLLAALVLAYLIGVRNFPAH
jgi:flagellar basal body-associated protein FliL